MKHATLLLLLMSCGGKEANSQINRDITVNGKTPSAYFKQLQFRVIGDCNEVSKLRFKKLSKAIGFRETILGKDSKDRDVILSLNLYLLRDDRFIAKIEERTVLEYIEGGYGFEATLNETIKGKTSLNSQGQLILEGLGKASAIDINDKKGVQLVLNDNIVHRSSYKYKGASMLLTHKAGNYSEIPYEDYCE